MRRGGGGGGGAKHCSHTMLAQVKPGTEPGYGHFHGKGCTLEINETHPKYLG